MRRKLPQIKSYNSLSRLRSSIGRVNNIMIKNNNAILNPSRMSGNAPITRLVTPRVKKAPGRVVNNLFRLSQRQLIAQTSSLISKISKRYL